MSGLAGKTRLVVGAVIGLGVMAPAWAEVRPAELPPADYRGMQYVDSKGCAFLRAGTEAEPIWVLRVSAGGAALCDNPPSGKRVPIAGEAGADTADVQPDAAAAEADTKAEPAESQIPAGAGDYIVAVGSFAVSENADKSVATLLALGYPASKGWLQGGSSDLVTVFAGPFQSKADADAARAALRGAGFPDAVVISL